MNNKATTMIRLFFLMVLSFQLFYPLGFSQSVNTLPPQDTTISDPISVDSLYISPANPREGDIIYLWAATTHSSSSCGLLSYSVISSSSNIIFVNAKYWEGMLTAICHSLDSMKLGRLKAGNYVLNFMNRKKIEFTVSSNQLIADFTYDYPKCYGSVKCGENSVHFNDKSLGNVTSWYWDFGDTTNSNLQNPLHLYKAGGIYNVCLTVSSNNTDTKGSTKCKLVPTSPNFCKAGFTYNIFDIPASLSTDADMMPFPNHMIHFNDSSAGEVVKREWNFGDGSYSNAQNPTHRYRDGVYVATLSITTKYGCTSKFSDSLFIYNPEPVCQYTGTVRDYSQISGCRYIIELDNGTKINPVEIPINCNCVIRDSQRVIIDYRPLKVATICMVGIPAEITCLRELIVPECKAFFTYNKDTLADCYCYYFYDQSVGKVKSWHWDFGDGSTSNEQNPKHVFGTSSVNPYYEVCLSIETADGCTSRYCEKIYIKSEVPWIPVIGGKEHHHILVPYCLKTSDNLEKGDYIGLFFKNTNGNLVCGGMIEWNDKTDVLTAWANTIRFDSIIIMDDSRGPIYAKKNGFYPGEKFEFKIWKRNTNKQIYIRESKYTINKWSPDSGYYKDNGVSLLKALINADEQTIMLYQGWNLVSLHVKPFDPRLSSIFANLDVIVKDYKGDIVYPTTDSRCVPVWNPYEGYKVNSNTISQITVSGTNIDPQTNIPLPGSKFPAFLPYYYPRPYPVVFMMNNVASNLRYLQAYELVNWNIKALNYIPKYNINQINFMKPGLGYKFSLYMAMRSFTYPPVISPLDTLAPQNGMLKPILPTGENNRVLVIPEKILLITPNAKINVFVNKKWVGYEYAVEGNNAVTMWDIDNSIGTDNFILEIMDNQQTIRYNLSFSKNTQVDGDLNILNDISTQAPVLESENQFIKVYPSPASQQFFIDLSLNKPQTIEVSLFDFLGKTVKQISVNTASSGLNRITVQLNDVTQGQYIYQVKTSNKIQRGKIQVIR